MHNGCMDSNLIIIDAVLDFLKKKSTFKKGCTLPQLGLLGSLFIPLMTGKPPTLEDVKDALVNLGQEKALGPNSFSIAVFRIFGLLCKKIQGKKHLSITS